METDNPSVGGGSPERFGFEWATYDKIDPNYEKQFRRWLPFYDKSDWLGKNFLDVGCGMGRNSYWPMSYGAANGLAIDVDQRSLEAARRTLRSFSDMQICAKSAYDIDQQNAFDIVFSIGVIHHLEFPEKALERMAAAARPGGDVAIWVYGRENNGWLLWILNPTRKLLFSRLPIRWVHALSIFPTAVLWVALRLGLDQIEYFKQVRTFSFAHLRSIVFDQLLPRIAHYWRRNEVEELMNQAGLEDIEIAWVNEMSWAARGMKPAIEAV